MAGAPDSCFNSQQPSNLREVGKPRTVVKMISSSYGFSSTPSVTSYVPADGT